MERKYLVTILVFLALNVCLSGYFLTRMGRRAETAPGGAFATATTAARKYTFYVGLNDKDTYTRLVDIDEARDRLNAVAVKYVDGFTVFRAQGFWRDEKGLANGEDTLVYEFVDAEAGKVTAMLDEMLVVMNQNSILVETAETNRVFYPVR